MQNWSTSSLFPAQLQGAFSSDWKTEQPWASTGLQIVWNNRGHFSGVSWLLSCPSLQFLCWVGVCSNLVPLKKTTRKPKRNIYFENFPHEFVLSLYLKTLLYNWNNVKMRWRIASQMWWNCYSVQQEPLSIVAGRRRACYLIKQRVKEWDQICICNICFHFPFPLAISDSNEDLWSIMQT